jgi:GNAT superfamily N-acetyltransferase
MRLSPPDIRERFQRLGQVGGDELDTLRAAEGTRQDYRRLSRFHYKAGEPVTMARVLTLRQREITVVGRYLGRRAEETPAAVLVVSLPHPGCRLRDLATAGRYRDLPRRQSLQLLNREVRTISRVVVDPQWRGLGLAVRLVRQAMRETTQPYLEALAAMGRVHPFFERAGMQRYDRPPLPGHQRLLDALAALGIEPWELASPARILRRTAGEPGVSSLLERELRRFARGAAHLPPAALRTLGLVDLVKLARDHLLCQPVYYLHRTLGG